MSQHARMTPAAGCMRNLFLMACFLALRAIAAELPVEYFFNNFQYDQAKLSPRGDALALLAPNRQHQGLAVVDLKQRQAKMVWGDHNVDVGWFRWFNNNRLLFSLAKDGYQVGGLFAVDRDGAKPRRLLEPLHFATHILDTLGGTSEEFLVESVAYSAWDRETRAAYPHIARMNIFNGSMTRELTNPGRVLEWLTDRTHTVRVGKALEEDCVKIIHRRGSGGSWETLAKYKYNEDGIEPIAFLEDNRTLLVKWHDGEATAGLYGYDTETKQITSLLFRHAEYDVESPILTKRGKLVGVAFMAERSETYWVDPTLRRLQASVDVTLPKTLNVLQISEDPSQVLIHSYSDRNPGMYYLFHTNTWKLEDLFPLAPWIHPEDLSETKPIQYRSRDGLTIHGYLTLPQGREPKNLPMIVKPHGGPWVRDIWQFDPEDQFLANRGYAVLKMNFRGSTGYGKKFLKAGFKEWGGKMQDDITDGVRWAIEQGIADAKRVGIFGASYGGFAVLAGLAFTPELYRCGVCYVGATDVLNYLRKRERIFALDRYFIDEAVGERRREEERLRATSPIYHVDKIRAPLLLAYGERDSRVPIEEGRRLYRRLKSQGNEVEIMVKQDEGHGFHKEGNRIEFYKKVDEFLKANLK